MEFEVRLNPASVRNLRESKSWTQEHLASAAGIGVRTIQRMEADGAASAESRLAVAAALGVPVETFNADVSTAVARAEPRGVAMGKRWGYAGLLVGALASSAGILSGSSNPAQVGVALGILGAFSGVVAAAIGVLSRRATEHTRDA